jgi:hypothetical protein
MFGLADDPPSSRPALARAVGEVLELALGAATGATNLLSLSKLRRDPFDQTIVARKAEGVVDLVGLAPRHQFVTGKSGVSAQPDSDTRPASAYVGDDPLDLFPGAGRGVDVRWPQLGGE